MLSLITFIELGRAAYKMQLMMIYSALWIQQEDRQPEAAASPVAREVEEFMESKSTVLLYSRITHTLPEHS